MASSHRLLIKLCGSLLVACCLVSCSWVKNNLNTSESPENSTTDWPIGSIYANVGQPIPGYVFLDSWQKRKEWLEIKRDKYTPTVQGAAFSSDTKYLGIHAGVQADATVINRYRAAQDLATHQLERDDQVGESYTEYQKAYIDNMTQSEVIDLKTKQERAQYESAALKARSDAYAKLLGEYEAVLQDYSRQINEVMSELARVDGEEKTTLEERLASLQKQKDEKLKEFNTLVTTPSASGSSGAITVSPMENPGNWRVQVEGKEYVLCPTCTISSGSGDKTVTISNQSGSAAKTPDHIYNKSTTDSTGLASSTAASAQKIGTAIEDTAKSTITPKDLEFIKYLADKSQPDSTPIEKVINQKSYRDYLDNLIQKTQLNNLMNFGGHTIYNIPVNVTVSPRKATKEPAEVSFSIGLEPEDLENYSQIISHQINVAYQEEGKKVNFVNESCDQEKYDLVTQHGFANLWAYVSSSGGVMPGCKDASSEVELPGNKTKLIVDGAPPGALCDEMKRKYKDIVKPKTTTKGSSQPALRLAIPDISLRATPTDFKNGCQLFQEFKSSVHYNYLHALIKTLAPLSPGKTKLYPLLDAVKINGQGEGKLDLPQEKIEKLLTSTVAIVAVDPDETVEEVDDLKQLKRAYDLGLDATALAGEVGLALNLQYLTSKLRASAFRKRITTLLGTSNDSGSKEAGFGWIFLPAPAGIDTNSDIELKMENRRISGSATVKVPAWLHRITLSTKYRWGNNMTGPTSPKPIYLHDGRVDGAWNEFNRWIVGLIDDEGVSEKENNTMESSDEGCVTIKQSNTDIGSKILDKRFPFTLMGDKLDEVRWVELGNHRTADLYHPSAKIVTGVITGFATDECHSDNDKCKLRLVFDDAICEIGGNVVQVKGAAGHVEDNSPEPQSSHLAGAGEITAGEEYTLIIDGLPIGSKPDGVYFDDKRIALDKDKSELIEIHPGSPRAAVQVIKKLAANDTKNFTCSDTGKKRCELLVSLTMGNPVKLINVGKLTLIKSGK